MASNKTKEKRKRVVLAIPDIYVGCPKCHVFDIIDSNLRKLEGVKDVKIKHWKLHIDYYPQKISKDEIKKAIYDMGFVISD